MEDLSPLLRQPVRFKIIEVNQSRRRAVGSIRMVAREERKEKWDERVENLRKKFSRGEK